MFLRLTKGIGPVLVPRECDPCLQPTQPPTSSQPLGRSRRVRGKHQSFGRRGYQTEGSIRWAGGFGGGQIGYNWQGVLGLNPNIVLGIEADIQGSGIEDNGPGIPPGVLPRIFEPFFTTKDQGAARGTGLGLSMLYTMAREDGIGVAVVTEVGRGTTFRLLLPVDGGEATGPPDRVSGRNSPVARPP